MKSDREMSIENISIVKCQINLQSELIIRQRKLSDTEHDSLISIKDLFLAKINQIENLVLKNESLKKFFVFVPNKSYRVFKFNKYCEFDNLFGKLIIFNHMPEKNFIKKFM